MRRIGIIVLLVLFLCSCSSSESGTSNSDLAIISAMNFFNGACVAEKADGTIFYTLGDRHKPGIFKRSASGEEALLIQDWATGLYATEDALYYMHPPTDTLNVFNFTTNEIVKVHDTMASSIVSTSAGVFFLARKSMNDPFELFSCSDNAISQRWEVSGIPANLTLRYLYVVDNDLYLVAGKDIYFLGTGHEAEKIFEAPEPIHKFFIINEDYYVVGNNSIFKLNGDKSAVNIAPNYIGLSTSVIVWNKSIIYSGLGGTYQYNVHTGKTKRLSWKMYQTIYVIQGKLFGVDY